MMIVRANSDSLHSMKMHGDDRTLIHQQAIARATNTQQPLLSTAEVTCLLPACSGAKGLLRLNAVQVFFSLSTVSLLLFSSQTVVVTNQLHVLFALRSRLASNCT